MQTLKHWLWRGLIALAVLLSVGALFVYVSLRASLPELDGEAQLVGLHQPVSVTRDALGVPTIIAGSRLDLARATGFVHGQDRFFQMDLMRRDAAGELAALFGARALTRDKKRRIHGLRRIADKMVANSTPERLAQLNAYTEGVNAGLGSLAVSPFEYAIVGHDPQPWQPADTGLVILAMWMTLTDEDGDRDLNLTRMRNVLPLTMFEYVTQAGSVLDAALDESKWNVLPVPSASDYDARSRVGALASLAPGSAPQVIPNDADLEGLFGSNNWAVTGARTRHGGAIVANDMHLSLGVPNIWYRARLVVDGQLDIVGVTLPGAPAIVVGSTGKIAWGFTNSNSDTTDLIAIETNPVDPRQYLSSDGMRDFATREETIEIAGAAPVKISIDETIWGPVRKADNKRYAVQWMAHRTGAVNLELMQFEHIESVEQALIVGPTVGMPPQNLAVVDAAGNAGWTLAGAVPAADTGNDRRYAIPSRSAVLMTHRSSSTMPRIVNPDDGNIYSANSRIVSANAYPGLSDGSYSLGSRQAQIRDGLRARELVDEATMLEIQLDDRALFMRRWYDLLVKVLTPDVAAQDLLRDKVRGVLPSWTGRADPSDVAYRWTREFRTSVTDLITEGLFAEVRAQYPDFELVKMRQLEGIVWQILTQRPMHMLNPRFKNYDELLVAAIDHCIKRVATTAPGPIEQRVFSEYNSGAIVHPLARALPQLGWLLNMPDVAISGDAYMPRVTRKRGGASERFSVSPGREEQAYFHMPGGQSGHPLSPFYDAGHMAWVRGEAMPLLPGKAAHTLTLTPL